MGMLEGLWRRPAPYNRVFRKTVEALKTRRVVNVDGTTLQQATSRLRLTAARVYVVLPEELRHMQNAEVVESPQGYEVLVDLRMIEEPLDHFVEEIILPRSFCYMTLDIIGDITGATAIRNGPAMPIPGNPEDHVVLSLADSVVSCTKLPRLSRLGRLPDAIWKELFDEERQQLKDKARRFGTHADRFTSMLIAGIASAVRPG